MLESEGSPSCQEGHGGFEDLEFWVEGEPSLRGLDLGVKGIEKQKRGFLRSHRSRGLASLLLSFLLMIASNVN